MRVGKFDIKCLRVEEVPDDTLMRMIAVFAEIGSGSDIPKPLAEAAANLAVGVLGAEAKRRGFEKVVLDESGVHRMQ